MTLTVARDTLERAPLPGDVFLLNWPRLGIDQMVVRVTGIDTGTLGTLEWRIEAMEDVFGLDNVVLAPPPPIIGEPTLEPLPPALVLALEIPYWELARVAGRTRLPHRHRYRRRRTGRCRWCRAIELATRHGRVRRRHRQRGQRGLRTAAHAGCCLARQPMPSACR